MATIIANSPIHRRQGDFSYGELFDKQLPDALPWYLPYLPGPGADPIGLPRPRANYKPNTYTVGFWTENREPTEDEKKWNEGENWKTSTIIKSVNEIESLTGYNFFSNIPSNIQDEIEKNRQIFWNGVIPDDFTPNPG